MISLVNRDREIYDLEYRVADIINEYQQTGKIDLDTNYEGLCLKRVKFYDVLDYLCDQFSIDKKKITIHTFNSLEKHDEYNIIVKTSHWLINTKSKVKKYYCPKIKKENLKTIGCFVGRVSWNRLILSSWLYKNYKDKCLISFNYNHTDVDKLCSDLTKINFYQADSIGDAVEFLKHTPILLDNLYHNKDSNITYSEHWKHVLNLLNYYDQIFLDLVVETYIMGNTFFPTEKTLRPIIAKTPFITLGPVNYLDNLRKLGFKTFSQWWDESYDYCEGIHRINEIKKVITNIMTWPQEKQQQVLKEMQGILDYNYNHYMDN